LLKIFEIQIFKEKDIKEDIKIDFKKVLGNFIKPVTRQASNPHGCQL